MAFFIVVWTVKTYAFENDDACLDGIFVLQKTLFKRRFPQVDTLKKKGVSVWCLQIIILNIDSFIYIQDF